MIVDRQRELWDSALCELPLMPYGTPPWFMLALLTLTSRREPRATKRRSFLILLRLSDTLPV